MTSIHICRYKDCYVKGTLGFIHEHEQIHKELNDWFFKRINAESNWE